jgi:two-component system, NarL family, response regulator DevR
MTDGPVRVFVVEDSQLLRERIVRDIAALGRFKIVGWAESQNEAVECIARLAPDVVVADLRLKEGSGLEVMRQVRMTCPAPPPSIVVLTNYGMQEYRQQCLKYGADDFFDKSSEYDQFLARMLNFTVH